MSILGSSVEDVRVDPGMIHSIDDDLGTVDNPVHKCSVSHDLDDTSPLVNGIVVLSFL